MRGREGTGVRGRGSGGGAGAAGCGERPARPPESKTRVHQRAAHRSPAGGPISRGAAQGGVSLQVHQSQSHVPRGQVLPCPLPPCHPSAALPPRDPTCTVSHKHTCPTHTHTRIHTHGCTHVRARLGHIVQCLPPTCAALNLLSASSSSWWRLHVRSRTKCLGRADADAIIDVDRRQARSTRTGRFRHDTLWCPL
jgi:hypothetical protein